MRTTEITPGLAVTVTRGYARRPATVDRVARDGKVFVSFTDVDPADLASIPPTHRGGLLGAVVTARQINPA